MHAFIEKLESAGEHFALFDKSDIDLLLSLCSDIRRFGARRDIIREGERPDHVNLMIEGWACRYKMLPDGSRQITALLLPGDICDAHITLFDEMDHSIGTLTECRVAYIQRDKMIELAERPRIARALWWASLVDEAVLRAWIVNLGRREALERVGHLICELYARLSNVGVAGGSEFALPLTQEDLADSLGLTSVHINRMLKRLRGEGLMTHRNRRLTILDVPGLQKLVGFDPNYLHLPKREAHANSRQPFGEVETGTRA